MAGNEPTMGLFRIQEHVHRTMPHIIQRKLELKKNLAQIEGDEHISSCCFFV